MIWERLPLEVRLYVLSCLGLRDLLCLRRVCRQLRMIIDTEANLQFIINVGASGLIENPSNTSPVSQKLESLRIADVAWTNLHWTRRIDIRDVPIKKVVGLSNGVLFFTTFESTEEVGSDTESNDEDDHSDVSSTTVNYIRLPSRRNLKPFVGPSLILNFHARAFAFEASRDLMVAAELSYTHGSTSYMYSAIVALHFRSITSNMKHPLSAQAMVKHTFFVHSNKFRLSIQICGNHVGVLLGRYSTSDGANDILYILDWTTGTSKALMNSEDADELWESFCFIALDAILLPDTLKGTLNIFFFNASPNSMEHVVTLVLPQTRQQPGLAYVQVFSEPPPTFSMISSSPLVDTPPFTADPESTLVYIRLDYFFPSDVGFWDGNILRQLMIVSRQVLLTAGRNSIKTVQNWLETDPPAFLNDILKKPVTKRVPLHSAENGWIYNSQWGLDASCFDFPYFAHGMRTVDYPQATFTEELPGFRAAYVYDFNMFNERRGITFYEENVRPIPDVPDSEWNEDSEWDWDDDTGNMRWPVEESRIFDKAQIVDLPELFVKPFVAALPYRSTRTEEILEWDFAMIDGERIIGVDHRSRRLTDLDIVVL